MTFSQTHHVTGGGPSVVPGGWQTGSSVLYMFLSKGNLYQAFIPHVTLLTTYTFFFPFFLFLGTPVCGIWKFLGQGLNLNCSWDSCHSWGNIGSFIAALGWGLNSRLCSNPSCCGQVLNPLHHIGNSQTHIFNKHWLYSHWIQDTRQVS